MAHLKLAYGKKEDISKSIDQGIIPPGSLIYTDDSREILFYDLNRKLCSYKEKNKFDSKSEAEEWVNKYNCHGDVISVYEGDKYNIYVVGPDNSLIPINMVEFIQEDWDQDDDTAIDYIKNRTHFVSKLSSSWGSMSEDQAIDLLDGTHNTGEIIISKYLTNSVIRQFTLFFDDASDYPMVMNFHLNTFNTIYGSRDTKDTYEIKEYDSQPSSICRIVKLNGDTAASASDLNYKATLLLNNQECFEIYFIGSSTDEFSNSGLYVKYINQPNFASQYLKVWIELVQYHTLNDLYISKNVEHTKHKVTTIDSSSTDTQYPSAKAVNKALENKINTPQVAKVGEVLTVEEVDDEGVVKKVKAAEEIDPKLIKDMYYSGREELISWTHDASQSTYSSDKEVELIAGNKYFVSINGIEYESIAKNLRISPWDYAICIGKKVSSDLPFDIYIFCKNGAVRVLGYLKASGIDAETGSEIKIYVDSVHTIDERYFPETIFTQGNSPVKFGDGVLSAKQGLETKASGAYSHAEGYLTTASGEASHAEGYETDSSGTYSHAEGYQTYSSGRYSHAEGYETDSSGDYSHAEGYLTTASGDASHAEGYSTVAEYMCQSVSGFYNIYDNRKYSYTKLSDQTYTSRSTVTYTVGSSFKFDYATGKFKLVNSTSKSYDLLAGKYLVNNVTMYYFNSIKSTSSSSVIYNVTKYTSALSSKTKGEYIQVVGNGDSDTNRSNAYTLDLEGNAWFAGDVYVGSTSGANKDEGSKKLLNTSDLLAFSEEVKDVTIQKPTTAQVGQIIKVKAVDKDGKITETEAVDMPEQVQSDWNENDPTKPDYVKNRPFYTGDPVETVLVEERTESFVENNSGLYMARFPSTFVATVGETYKVSWDSTVYECTCVDIGELVGVDELYVIGNLSISGAGSDTGEPFLMVIENGGISIGTADTSASHTFSISSVDIPVVKIDKKYLVQPDWNQNDETAADYVKNRTHYVLPTTPIGSLEFTATATGTIAYTMTGEEAEYEIFLYFQKLTGKGEVLKVIVNGKEGLLAVAFDRGNFSFSGVFSGGVRWNTGNVLSLVAQNDFITFNQGDTYTVSFEDATTPYYSKLDFNYLPDNVYHSENAPVKFGSGELSAVQGYNTEASGNCSHAEGYGTVASGNYSHAEGYGTVASGYYSHAEGYGTVASGYYSHAEGRDTVASGESSHAEGGYTVANRKYMHVEGVANKFDESKFINSVGSGNEKSTDLKTHYAAQEYTFDSDTGYYTLIDAEIKNEVVVGLYYANKKQYDNGKITSLIKPLSIGEDGWCVCEILSSVVSYYQKDKYIHVAGNGDINDSGTVTLRSNAYTLDWNGNAWFAGDVFIGGSSQDDGVKLLKTGEAIPDPQTASVGQVLVVKAVDKDGKITETEAVDLNTSVTIAYDEKTGNLQIGG